MALVSIDGCRPDYFSFADIPNIKKLMSAGVTYEQAWVGQLRNDTPPGHVTISTGVFPRNHGVIGFHWQDPATGKQFKPTTWFGVARGQLNDLIASCGCSSIGSIYKRAHPDAKAAALSSNKFYAAAALGADCADFIGYCRYEPPKGFGTDVGLSLSPETVTGRQAPVEIMGSPDLKRKVASPCDGDTWTMDFALELLKKEKPEILLLNLALCDDIGHTHGANLGREQMAGIIANVDRQIGRLVEAYKQAGIYEQTLFVITSDHGMSANLRTIDETPMSQIAADYGMKRSAARLEFYINDPSKAGEAAEKIARLRLGGIHAVYYKEKNGKGGYHYLPAPSSAIDGDLDACYRYLTSTYSSPQSVDLVLFPAENWNAQESTSYFKGDHGTATWENQHIPLIVSGPGIGKGTVSQAPARLVDIAPTVLTAMGLKREKMDGVVLADALESPAAESVGSQQALNAQITPLRDALKQRREEDIEGRSASQRETARSAAGNTLTERFRRFDRNGDRKVTREEAGNAPWFDRLDRNRDGAVTPEELGQPVPASTERFPQPIKKTEVAATQTTWVGANIPFEFTRDFTPGSKDSKGQMRTGQELMRIVACRGELFASTSVFTDPRAYTRDPDYTGCQVLRKSNSKSDWEVDVSFGRRYLRTDCLEVVRFTRDSDANPLPEPVEMLVAGIWDVGEMVRASADTDERDAVGREVARSIFGRNLGNRAAAPRVTAGNRHITLAIRDDASGKWTMSQVARVPDAERGFSSVRAIKIHRDQVTGAEYLFVGAACGGLYKGVYDPGAPGRIRWLEGDDMDASFGRVHSMCVCNGSLYVSTDYGGLTVQEQKGGIFRRIDGEKPTWERVYFNHDPKYPTWNQTARGITAVPAGDGTGKEVILVGVEWPPAPLIVRIEPHNDHRAVTELNYHDYFTQVFGREPQILGGSKQYPHAGCECAALNYFEPFINPETGKTERFVTLFLIHPDDPAAGSNGAYFLIRRGPGIYDWGEIPSGLPAGQHLRGTRTVEKSPFPDEPHTYYFGGCFNGPDEQPPKPNMAWIYKGAYNPTAEEKP